MCASNEQVVESVTINITLGKERAIIRLLVGQQYLFFKIVKFIFLMDKVQTYFVSNRDKKFWPFMRRFATLICIMV